MQPPICSYCMTRFDPFKTKGDTLSFAISAEDKAANERMRESRRTGHPKGLEWICELHMDAAREFTDLRWRDAREAMRRRLEESKL